MILRNLVAFLSLEGAKTQLRGFSSIPVPRGFDQLFRGFISCCDEGRLPGRQDMSRVMSFPGSRHNPGCWPTTSSHLTRRRAEACRGDQAMPEDLVRAVLSQISRVPFQDLADLVRGQVGICLK